MTHPTSDTSLAYALRMLAACLAVSSLGLLLVACGGESDARGTETRCEDRKDGDRDGLFDCKDPDCANLPVCVREHCYNLLDDDGDGLVDCDDDQCDGRSVCSGSAEDCVNGVDDDADGDADCDDSGCADTAACAPNGENCTNGTDDNADGAVDCDDDACKGTAVCARKLEYCDDGDDNDTDGAIDCDDSDCARTAACLEGGEDCSNGVDDDGDGRLDCQDTDCANSGTCLDLAEDCGNDLDDDGDGLVDCADPSCSDSSACSLSCQQDRDNDGTPDCEDDDADGDGIDDDRDPCPRVASSGDDCTDTDGDFVGDALDNCPSTPNTDQRDRDQNGDGNACDPVESLDNADITITAHPNYPGRAHLLDAGDFDGDGLADLLFEQTDTERNGAYFLLSDAASLRDSSTSLDSASIEAPFTQRAPYLEVGDINADGTADLLHSSLRGADQTEVAVLLGPFREANDFDRDQAARTITFATPQDSTDWTLAFDDVDGDGRDDVMIGLPSNLQMSGALYGFDSSIVDGGAGPDLTLDLASWTVPGALPGGAFGSSIQRTSDFDSDGLDDWGISADPEGAETDRLFILSAAAMLASASSDEASLSVLSGRFVSYSARLVPDIDGNGLEDIHLRSASCGSELVDEGQAVLSLTQPLQPRFYKENARVFMCSADIDYEFDGPASFVDIDYDDVGEYFSPTRTGNQYSVYFFESWYAARNAPESPTRQIDAPGSGGYLQVRELGDIDQNGQKDIVIYDQLEGAIDLAHYIWLWP